MAFKLGNHYIDEILYGVAEKNGNISYALDQLSSASIEISADSTDITDKKGNVIRTTYRAKTGTFTATNALLHPAAINAQSGSDIEYATAQNMIQMPKIIVEEPGKDVPVGNYVTGTIRVIGLFGNGANDVAMTEDAVSALLQGTGNDTVLKLPAKNENDDNAPIKYLVKWERNVSDGAMLQNTTAVSSDLVKLTLFCAMGDPCSDSLRPCYVVIPRFAADPSMTISLDAETQEIDFSGNLNVDYCAGTSSLYYIYYPNDDLVVTGAVITDTRN